MKTEEKPSRERWYYAMVLIGFILAIIVLWSADPSQRRAGTSRIPWPEWTQAGAHGTEGGGIIMDGLTLFGLVAVTAMLICYALEARSHWFILGFALACALGSVYGFLQGAWPFGVVEAIWSLVAARRWWVVRELTQGWKL